MSQHLELFQVVKCFKGTNGAYYHAEELSKIKTGGALFVILPPYEKADYERKHDCLLYSRSDDSFTLGELKLIAKDYKGTLVKEEAKTRVRCPDCGEWGEIKGHMTCQYPQD